MDADIAPAGVKPVAPRTEERLGLLADLTIEVLLSRARAGTITAAELTVATNYLKTAGIKPVISATNKVGELVKSLPQEFPELDLIVNGQGQ